MAHTTNRRWFSKLVPVLVLLLGVLVLGVQALSAPSTSHVPSVPVVTAGVAAPVRSVTPSSGDSLTVTMDGWQETGRFVSAPAP